MKYIYFFIFFVTTTINSIKSESQTLSPRYGHTSTCIDSTIYILGGVIDNSLTNEFFSIDVSPSSLSSLKTNLTYLNTETNMDFVTPHAFAQTSLGFNASTTEKNTLYLFGGIQNNLFEFDLSKIFAYNTVLNKWIRPNIDKTPLRKHSSFRLISSNFTENNDSIYMFSARVDISEMDLFDSKSLSFNLLNTTNQLYNAHGFTATLLRNGIIVYLGGSILSDGNNQGLGGELFSRNHQFARNDVVSNGIRTTRTKN
jgi:hypothetical protein